MNTSERITIAYELMRQSRNHMADGECAVDPVGERKELAQAATKLRRAADFLDDEGRLQD